MFGGKTMKKVSGCKRIGTRREVMNGSATMTPGGLTKQKLMLSNGRIRTKAGIKKGKKNEWAMSMKEARGQLMKSGVIKKNAGFVALNDGSKEGNALYKLTKKIYASK